VTAATGIVPASDWAQGAGPGAGEVVMVCQGLADGRRTAEDGQFLRSYDPDVITPLGFGAIHWTARLAKAMRFPSQEAAWRCWRTQSVRYPVRPWDGKPNRPLTAFNVEIVPVDHIDR
jgi:hypothetical protein